MLVDFIDGLMVCVKKTESIVEVVSCVTVCWREGRAGFKQAYALTDVFYIFLQETKGVLFFAGKGSLHLTPVADGTY